MKPYVYNMFQSTRWPSLLLVVFIALQVLLTAFILTSKEAPKPFGKLYLRHDQFTTDYYDAHSILSLGSLQQAEEITRIVIDNTLATVDMRRFPPARPVLEVSLPASVLEPIQKGIHIVLILHNNIDVLIRNLQYLSIQLDVNWRKVYLHILDDGSDKFSQSDVLSALWRYSLGQLQYTYFRNEKTMGAGYCAWFLLTHIQAMGGISDVVVMLGRGASLSTEDALRTVNNIYLSQKPILAYGPCNDPMCKVEEPETLSPDRRPMFLLTFECGHLTELTETDFRDSAGDWLRAGVEIAYASKLLRAAGGSRTALVGRTLLTARAGATKPVQALAPRRDTSHDASAEDFRSRAQIKKYLGVINVVMCIFNTPEQFPRILKMLASQRTNGRQVKLWVCNNDKSVGASLREQAAASPMSMSVHIFDMPPNAGGVDRLFLATWLRRSVMHTDYIIMLDDNISFGDDSVLLNVYQAGKPKTFACWYGRQFLRNYPYWNSSLIIGKPIAVPQESDSLTLHQCGTGLSIIDGNIFASSALLNIPAQYQLGEDLWLSAVALEAGYTLRRIFTNAAMIQEDEDMWRAVGKYHLKNDLLWLLRNEFGYPH